MIQYDMKKFVPLVFCAKAKKLDNIISIVSKLIEIRAKTLPGYSTRSYFICISTGHSVVKLNNAQQEQEQISYDPSHLTQCCKARFSEKFALNR
jgi:hypothetical protein